MAYSVIIFHLLVYQISQRLSPPHPPVWETDCKRGANSSCDLSGCVAFPPADSRSATSYKGPSHRKVLGYPSKVSNVFQALASLYQLTMLLLLASTWTHLAYARGQAQVYAEL